MSNTKKILEILKNSAIDLSFQAASTAVCSYVARKVNFYMDDQDQKRIQQDEQAPPPTKKRIGFSNEQ